MLYNPFPTKKLKNVNSNRFASKDELKDLTEIKNFPQYTKSDITRPDASKRTQTYPNRSKQVQTGLDTSGNSEKLAKTWKNFAKTSKMFAKLAKLFPSPAALAPTLVLARAPALVLTSVTTAATPAAVTATAATKFEIITYIERR